MEFFSTIWMSIAAFLGLGQPEPAPLSVEPAVVEERQEVTETSQAEGESTVANEEVAAESAASETAETDASAEAEPAVAAQMQGEAKPISTPTPAPEPATTPDIETMMVAGGCFWCVEADLEKTPGVISVVSGYAGGTTANPTYENYGSGGHREVVEVTYDANLISFEEILIVTMKTTDPTDDDGTFADRGDKYSAAFYYETEAERQIIADLIDEVNEFGPYDEPLAIDIETRPRFWKAEDFHQDYYKGTLSQLKYKYYRNASGRDDFINQYWDDRTPTLPWRPNQSNNTNSNMNFWENYQKPSQEVLEAQLSDMAFKVTQEDGTERAGTSPLDKNWEDGIYVDILSGEPLFSSADKYDSGTGWPSFVKPIEPGAVTEHEDRKLFSVRTEIRSRYGDNHIGHVFTDGPADRGGLRYCMNGVALRFVPKDQMAAEGYGDYLDKV